MVVALVEAALDQPNPTPELGYALNLVLVALGHPAQLLPRLGDGSDSGAVQP